MSNYGIPVGKVRLRTAIGVVLAEYLEWNRVADLEMFEALLHMRDRWNAKLDAYTPRAIVEHCTHFHASPTDVWEEVK